MSKNLKKPFLNKTRLVLYLSTFPQLSETFLVSKFSGLQARGWDVHILCSHFNKTAWHKFPALSHELKTKKRVHSTWPTQPRWLAIPLFLPALMMCFIQAPRRIWQYFRLGWSRFGWGIFKKFYLAAALIPLKPDILHFEFGSLAVGRTYLKELLGTKLSVSFRGYDLNYIGLENPDYYNQVWEKVDAAHLLGEDLWRRAQHRGAPEDLPHALIPPAVDLLRFPENQTKCEKEIGTLTRHLRVLSVGRLHWKKGYEFSLQAVRRLVDQGFCLEYRIIGDGDYQDALYFARHQLNLEDEITFIGGLPHDKVLDNLQWADIFLHGAVSEGFCNAVLEAQAMGVPVVCTDADGLPENVADGITGFIVPRRDPTAMADKLATLAGNGELRQKMGAAGSQRVEAHFRMDQQLDAFEDFYESL